MAPRTDRISRNEHKVLGLIAAGVSTGPDLARHMHRSAEGIHQTAASLVRKGWAYRETRPTRYTITNAGTAMLSRVRAEPDLVRGR